MTGAPLSPPPLGPAPHDASRFAAQQRFGLNFFCLFAVFGVVAPYLQVLLDARGFSKQNIGFILGGVEAAGLVSPLLWGWVSDHSRHRRSIMAAAVLGAGATFLLFGRVAGVGVGLAVALCFGFFVRPIIPLTDGFVLRYLSEHRGDYGRARVWGSLSFVFTILVLEALGVADEQKGTRLILGAVVVLTLFHLGSVSLLPLTANEHAVRSGRTPYRRVEFDWSLLRSRAFVILLAVGFLGRMAMQSQYSFFTLFVREEIGYAQAGKLWTLGALAEIPVIFFSGVLIARLGIRNLLVLGLLGATLRITGYAVAPILWVVVALQALHALAFGAFHVATVTFVARLVPSGMKQSAMAVFVAVSMGLGAILGSALGGVLIEHFGYRAMYGVFSCIGAASCVAAWLFLAEPSPHTPEP